MSDADPSREDLRAVAALLPAIRNIEAHPDDWRDGGPATDGAPQLPYLEYRSEVQRLVSLCHEHRVILDFDWGAWRDTAERFQDPDVLAGASLLDIRRLLTFHIRADRLKEGHLAGMIRSGHIAMLLHRLGERAESILPEHPIAWLERNEPGFARLNAAEREAIMHFALLWSLFEAKALNTNGSANAIRRFVERCAERRPLELDRFEDALTYVRKRYWTEDGPSQHFDGLNLRRNDHPELVCLALEGSTDSPVDCLTALLIVIFRYRNNLFHGTKWNYALEGQLDNFVHANAALMTALSILVRD